MNATARLIPAVLAAVAAVAALAASAPGGAAVVPAPVLLMPTVEVVARREALPLEVVELPRVEVIGRRETLRPQAAQRTAAPRS